MALIGRFFLATSKRRLRRINAWRADPVPTQAALLMQLLRRAARTQFGREHSFAAIRSVKDYQQRVPLRTYAEFKPYWDRLFDGETDLTWPGSIRYFPITAGTTAAKNKLIPLSREGLRSNLRAGRDIINFYLAQTRDAGLFSGKFIFLGGSTDLTRHPRGQLVGDLSGIVAREIPWYVNSSRLPTGDVAFMTDWEKKLDAIAAQAWRANVRGISGTPSWLICLFDRVIALHRNAGREVNALADIWPNLSLLIHGGVDFTPYRETFAMLFGKPVHTIETYPASEGFIAIQDQLDRCELLLMMDLGVFHEFVPAEELDSAKPARFTVADVEKDVNYAIVVTTNSGLWSYVLGDTVRFTSLRPHRLRVTGRTQHFLSAFGEHVIVEEVDKAITAACSATGAQINEYHVAPLYPSTQEMRPGHQWLVEFIAPPADLNRFRDLLDRTLQSLNDDYAAHRQGDAGMKPPELVAVPQRTFFRAMKEIGRLGGQNKVPRLKNNREFADVLLRAARST